MTGIKLEAKENQLRLIGSDADISVESFITNTEDNSPLEVAVTGGIVVKPARILSDIVKKLPDEEVTLEVVNQSQVAITSDTSSFVINGLDIQQYPNLPEVDRSSGIVLPSLLLKQVIDQTVIAVSKHESRPILTGVQFVIDEGVLTAVATDSHRLSRRSVPVNSTQSQHQEFVIPGKSLTELNRLMTPEIENVTLYVADSQVLFEVGQNHLYSRLLEGNYPDTSRLIPTESNTQVILEARALAAAVDRASLLSHAGKNNVIKLSIAENHMEVSGDYPDVGRIEEDIDYESIDGESIAISFNPDFMKDALRAFGPIDVKIDLIGALRPFTIRPADGSNQFVQLITPIRTPE